MAVSAKVASAYIDLEVRTAALKKAMDDATSEMRRFSGVTREETEKSRESVRLLSESIGVHIPRGLQNVIAKLPAVTTAMNMAFDAVVVLALIHVVVEVTEKVAEFVKKNEEAARKSLEVWTSSNNKLVQTRDELNLTNLKLENQIALLEHKPQNMLAQSLLEARVEAEKLNAQLEGAIKEAGTLLEGNQAAWYSRALTGESGTGYEQTMSEEHGLHMDAALTSIAAQKTEADNFAASLSSRMSELLAFQRGFKDYVDASGAMRPISKDLLSGSSNPQPEIDAVRVLQERNQIERDVIAASMATPQLQKTLSDLQQSAAIVPSLRPGYSPFASNMSQIPQGAWSWTGQAPQYAADDANQPDAMSIAALSSLSKYSSTAMTVKDVPAASELKLEVDGMFDDWIDHATNLKDVTHQLFEDMRKGVDSINEQIVKWMSGDRTNFRGALRGTAQGFARTGLESAEGDVMKLFGLGGKQGTRGNPMFVKDVDGAASMPTGALPGGAGGLMGAMNNSDFFGGLFGGRLFGAGGVFGGGHALGGATPANVPIPVGELGPEIFTPAVPGAITSNRDMRASGGGVHMTIDARGTDPSLTRENFQRALGMVYRKSVADASHGVMDKVRRTAR